MVSQPNCGAREAQAWTMRGVRESYPQPREFIFTGTFFDWDPLARDANDNAASTDTHAFEYIGLNNLAAGLQQADRYTYTDNLTDIDCGTDASPFRIQYDYMAGFCRDRNAFGAETSNGVF